MGSGVDEIAVFEMSSHKIFKVKGCRQDDRAGFSEILSQYALRPFFAIFRGKSLTKERRESNRKTYVLPNCAFLRTMTA
jgi:hypothetical protein